MPDGNSSLGLLLVGHGTASEIGTGQFLALSGQLADRLSPIPVELAFLEMRQPDIAAALCRLIERGAAHHVMVPLLLFEAGHAKRDIPAAVAGAIKTLLSEAKENWPEASRVTRAQSSGQNIFFVASQAEPLGCHPAIIELSQRRYREALAGKPPVPPDKTALVLVGRGSYDESATAAMHDFARLRQQAEMPGTVHVGFLAMARPLLSDLLPQVAAMSYRRVVVQPHLLFEGELADTVRRQVAEAGRQHPAQEWLLAPLLADPQDSPGSGNEYLLRAICDRFHDASPAAGPT